MREITVQVDADTGFVGRGEIERLEVFPEEPVGGLRVCKTVGVGEREQVERVLRKKRRGGGGE